MTNAVQRRANLVRTKKLMHMRLRRLLVDNYGFDEEYVRKNTPCC